jgi:hypothetical protein
MIEAAEQQLLIAQRLWEEGKVEESLQTLNLLMVRNPEYGKAHAFLGMLLFQHFSDFLHCNRKKTAPIRRLQRQE